MYILKSKRDEKYLSDYNVDLNEDIPIIFHSVEPNYILENIKIRGCNLIHVENKDNQITLFVHNKSKRYNTEKKEGIPEYLQEYTDKFTYIIYKCFEC